MIPEPVPPAGAAADALGRMGRVPRVGPSAGSASRKSARRASLAVRLRVSRRTHDQSTSAMSCAARAAPSVSTGR